MRISIIVIYDRNRAIGHNNKLPWHLPADLAHFKRATMGCPVIMGRNTFASIGKPLPGRHNIVVSASGNVRHDGVTVTSSLESALAASSEAPEVFIIGGAQLYQRAINVAQRIVATEIDGEFTADTFFPALDRKIWCETSRNHRPTDEKNPFAMDFVLYERAADALN